MLRLETIDLHWFLPTTFTQIVISRGPIPHATLTTIETAFMGQGQLCLQDILSHLVSQSLVSCGCRRSLPHVYVSHMGSFRLSSFTGELICGLVSLHCSTRASNDCGMFVAQWMIMYHLWGTYDAEKVTDYSRMCLTVHMLLRYHNDNREKIVNVALGYWRNFVPIHQTQLYGPNMPIFPLF
ncbi:hypothetical protein AHAS_Ahas12G0140400 [Arachis hypogaea]